MEMHLEKRELVSALVDGELDREKLGSVLALSAEEGHQCWQTYQLIGDVLRSPELSRSSDAARLIAGVRSAMSEDKIGQRLAAESSFALSESSNTPARNDSVFRWKMVAGLASLFAVAAISWNSFYQWNAGGTSGAQLASIAADSGEASQVAVLQPADASQASSSSQIMIRDPRLDELLAAHRQFSGTSALQMPAGFLRNANFDKAKP